MKNSEYGYINACYKLQIAKTHHGQTDKQTRGAQLQLHGRTDGRTNGMNACRLWHRIKVATEETEKKNSQNSTRTSTKHLKTQEAQLSLG